MVRENLNLSTKSDHQMTETIVQEEEVDMSMVDKVTIRRLQEVGVKTGSINQETTNRGTTTHQKTL
jgi:hypothetical protein